MSSPLYCHVIGKYYVFFCMEVGKLSYNIKNAAYAAGMRTTEYAITLERV